MKAQHSKFIAKFPLGEVVATPGALEALREAGQSSTDFLSRHVQGDWGVVCPDDAAANEQSLLDGSRLLSAYQLKTGQKIWLITEAAGDDGARGSTCVLLPEEY